MVNLTGGSGSVSSWNILRSFVLLRNFDFHLRPVFLQIHYDWHFELSVTNFYFKKVVKTNISLNMITHLRTLNKLDLLYLADLPDVEEDEVLVVPHSLDQLCVVLA